MAKGHRSQIKRARNENNRETRPSAKLSYARISVQKACYVLDAIRVRADGSHCSCRKRGRCNHIGTK